MLELPSLHSFWLIWATGDILGKIWMVEVKQHPYSSLYLEEQCRVLGAVIIPPCFC